MTKAAELAKEYQRLGGKRLAKMDDNIISTRKWEDEPAEASAFWKEIVEVLVTRSKRRSSAIWRRSTLERPILPPNRRGRPATATVPAYRTMNHSIGSTPSYRPLLLSPRFA